MKSSWYISMIKIYECVDDIVEQMTLHLMRSELMILYAQKNNMAHLLVVMFKRNTTHFTWQVMSTAFDGRDFTSLPCSRLRFQILLVRTNKAKSQRPAKRI